MTIALPRAHCAVDRPDWWPVSRRVRSARLDYPGRGATLPNTVPLPGQPWLARSGSRPCLAGVGCCPGRALKLFEDVPAPRRDVRLDEAANQGTVARERRRGVTPTTDGNMRSPHSFCLALREHKPAAIR